MELRRNILGCWVGVVMYEHLEIDSDLFMKELMFACSHLAVIAY